MTASTDDFFRSRLDYMIDKKGLGPFLRLLQAAGWTDFRDLQRKLRGIFTVKPTKSGSMSWVVG